MKNVFLTYVCFGSTFLASMRLSDGINILTVGPWTLDIYALLSSTKDGNDIFFYRVKYLLIAMFWFW